MLGISQVGVQVQVSVFGVITARDCPLSPLAGQRSVQCAVELETKVHTKVRNHREGPY